MLPEEQHRQQQEQAPKLLVAELQPYRQVNQGCGLDVAGELANWLRLAFIKRHAGRLRAYLEPA